jgi:hypothetical protein
MRTPLDDLHAALRLGPLAGVELRRALGGISAATLSRMVASGGTGIVRRGGSRRIRYGLRRSLRGQAETLTLYRIDAQGVGHLVGHLDLVAPEGSALALDIPFAWPLDPDSEMRDGWFDGLPYPLFDMRPQGFIGRNFALLNAPALGVPEDLARWSDDDVVHALANVGHDLSGDLILGARAYDLHLAARHEWERKLIRSADVPAAYPDLAQRALAHGFAGSSAAGEFPKFAIQREIDGEPVSVIVKFSGADDSPAVRRWSDLLVSEHLALETLAAELGIESARSTIRRYAGRTFLEVIRFDRSGPHGRLALCSLGALNGALLGMPGASWPTVAEALHRHGWLPADDVSRIGQLWWFGRLIANTDMHEGNLSFRPGLSLAPAYDMLPMAYAPLRGGELPGFSFAPPQARPEDAEARNKAASAAIVFWQRCAMDDRISKAFREICTANAGRIEGFSN